MEKREPKTVGELREEFRYTLNELAKGTGIPYGTIVRYNYGTRRISLDNAKKLADFLGIPLEAIKTNE